MEGRILKYFVTIQEEYLKNSDSYLNGQDWVKQFLSKILKITHSQWIFRNITFHDKKGGVLKMKMGVDCWWWDPGPLES